MSDPTSDPSIEPLNPSRRLFRSKSVTPGDRTNARNKYNEYLKKLQERNKLLKESTNEHRLKDDNLKQRESGFQLYVNGAHSTPPPRPPSAMRKRTKTSSNQMQTLSSFFSDFSSPTLSNVTRRSNFPHPRRRWMLTTQTKIQTEQGLVIADINSPTTTSNFHTKQSQQVNNQLTYRLITSMDVDQSWMPNWYRNTGSNKDDYSFKRSLSLSLDDTPTTISLTRSQQQTYRLSTTVGR